MAAECTVLLIDDEEELVSALAERLGYRGIQADVATTGPSALEQMKLKRYDIVILDLKLPGVSGVTVLREIGTSYPDIPVILITGHGAPVDLPEFKSGEAFDYLPKPIELDILIQTMQRALGRT